MNEYMAFEFRMIDFLAIMPSSESEFRYTTLRRVVILTATLLLFTSGAIELTRIFHDFSLFNDILSLVWLGMMGLSKYFTLLYYRRRVTNLRNEINEQKINNDTSTADDSLLAEYDKVGSRFAQTIGITLVVVGTGIFFQNIPPYIRTNILTLPVEIYYPFNLDNWGWFILAYVHQAVSYAVHVIVFIAFGGQLISLTLHSCGHYRILQNYLERIAEDENWVEYGEIDTQKRVVKIVRLHQNILRLNEDIEDFTCWPSFVQFLVSAIALCTSTYELTSGHVSLERMLKHVTSLVGQFAELILFNYCGQLIQDASFEVSNAISRSNFYNIGLRHQKDLKFILTRAQKPMYLTAGKFCNLSVENIINILKATTTYFAMFATLDSQSNG